MKRRRRSSSVDFANPELAPPKHKVHYWYDPEIPKFSYGADIMMEPARLEMTHELIKAYKLDKKLELHVPEHPSTSDMAKFHDVEYLRFLKNPPFKSGFFNVDCDKFNVGSETTQPLSRDLYTFCKKYVGASLGCAQTLNSGEADICINWSGGLHHAAKDRASGFCYVNDIVLAILELLKTHKRVIYVDIDAHHGDAVEQAFLQSNRVLTLSFHLYDGVFFPGTGETKSCGEGTGLGYAVNVPLRAGIDDPTYKAVFEPVVGQCILTFEPEVIVLQCGADSIAADQLGAFNMTTKGHGDCIRFIKQFNIPLLVLGGGGYTPANVARCWTYETAILLNTRISTNIPEHEYSERYGPEECRDLHVQKDYSFKNLNDPKYIEYTTQKVMENLRHIDFVPSVQLRAKFSSELLSVIGKWS